MEIEPQSAVRPSTSSSDDSVEIIPATPEKVKCLQSTTTRFTYTWYLKNFRKTFNHVSRVFVPDLIPELKWRLELTSSQSKAIPNLCLLPCVISGLTVEYTLSFLNSSGRKTLTTSSRATEKVVSPTAITEYPPESYFDLSDVRAISVGQLPQINLKLYCEIKLIVKRYDGVIKVPDRQLQCDFGSLFGDKKFSDITINVDEQEIAAHKVILSVRSSVFAAMFERETPDNRLDHVNINDFQADVIREMLRYIYTEQAPNIDKMADKLLIAAEKYNIVRLKIMCEETLRSNLTIDNATDTLIFADLHNAELKAHALDFMAANTTEIMETASFKNMVTSHPFLVAEILRTSAAKKNSIPNGSTA